MSHFGTWALHIVRVASSKYFALVTAEKFRSTNSIETKPPSPFIGTTGCLRIDYVDRHRNELRFYDPLLYSDENLT
jgi:hypothetical protein